MGVCGKDAHGMTMFLDWLRLLGGVRHIPLVLAVSDTFTTVSPSLWQEIESRAAATFRNVNVVAVREPVTRYYQRAANDMFRAAMMEASKHERPIMWLESDCIPYKPDWWRLAMSCYEHASGLGFRYSGPIVHYKHPTTGSTTSFVNGTAIYPHDWREDFDPNDAPDYMGWDAWFHDVTYPQSYEDVGWYNLCGSEMHFDSPSDKRLEGRYMVHRVKDGSLFRTMHDTIKREKHDTESSMMIAISVCTKDAEQAVRLSEWIDIMGVVRESTPFLLMVESTIKGETKDKIITNFKKSFPSAVVIEIEDADNRGWPESANTAFRLAIEWRSSNLPDTPMLWLEADCAPLKPDWLELIIAEHKSKGGFLGEIVSHAGKPYLAGVAVYPANALELAPELAQFLDDNRNKVEDGAWDRRTNLGDRPYVHQSHTIQHVYATSCDWSRRSHLSRIRKSAALYHRDKTGALIELLSREYNFGRSIMSSPVVQKKFARYFYTPSYSCAIEHGVWIPTRRCGGMFPAITKVEDPLIAASIANSPHYGRIVEIDEATYLNKLTTRL